MDDEATPAWFLTAEQGTLLDDELSDPSTTHVDDEAKRATREQSIVDRSQRLDACRSSVHRSIRVHRDYRFIAALPNCIDETTGSLTHDSGSVTLQIACLENRGVGNDYQDASGL